MLLFLLLVIISIVLILIAIDYKDFLYHHCYNYADEISLFTTLLSIFIVIACLVIIVSSIGSHIQGAAAHNKLRARQEALTYKVESAVAKDDFGLLNEKYLNQIQDWNEEITYGASIQRNIWVGMLYPNIYDDLHTIDLNQYKTGHQKSINVILPEGGY